MKKQLSTILIIVWMLSVCSQCDDPTSRYDFGPNAYPSITDYITSAPWQIRNYSSTAKDSLTISTLKRWNDNLLNKAKFIIYNKNGTWVQGDSAQYGNWVYAPKNSLDPESIIFDKGTTYQIGAIINYAFHDSLIITYPWKMNDTLTSIVTETCTK
jgi:hypothetical protein